MYQFCIVRTFICFVLFFSYWKLWHGYR